MRPRPSDDEIARRIAALIASPSAGRAVAGQLNQRNEEWAHRAVVDDLRARRFAALCEARAADAASEQAAAERVGHGVSAQPEMPGWRRLAGMH